MLSSKMLSAYVRIHVTFEEGRKVMNMSMYGLVEEIPLLRDQECQEIYRKVYNVSHQWIQRHYQLPFYTLGVAAYLDATANLQNYYKLLSHYNSLLRENFAELYQKILLSLQQHLNCQVTYHPDQALPGFHIFGYSKQFEQCYGYLHYDSQYKYLQWQESESFNFSNPIQISFTLAISLPACGSGLNLFNIQKEKWEKMITDKQCKKTDIYYKLMKMKTYIPYTIGNLYLYCGHPLHQIAPAKELLPKDDRITFQGHGVKCDDTWYLYW